jgi:hypothetical protein
MVTGRIPATGSIVHAAGALDAGRPSGARYVNQVPSDGWLMAQVDGTALRVALLKYTKVTILGASNGRTKFRVEDGHARGKTVSLSDANARTYLGTQAPQPSLAKATVTYGKYVEHWISAARRGEALDQQMATLAIGALSVPVTMNSVWGARYTPMPPGEYRVLLPDGPHQGRWTHFYRDADPRLKYDQVWFPIQYGDNSRFIHVGNLSEGCTTVLDLAHWADVHEALVSHRGPDGLSVATLAVRGKPERER